MVFKDNDKRLTRYLRIVRIDGEKIFFVSSEFRNFPNTNFISREFVSKKPGRFHRRPKQSGYTLVKISDTETGKQ